MRSSSPLPRSALPSALRSRYSRSPRGALSLSLSARTQNTPLNTHMRHSVAARARERARKFKVRAGAGAPRAKGEGENGLSRSLGSLYSAQGQKVVYRGGGGGSFWRAAATRRERRCAVHTRARYSGRVERTGTSAPCERNQQQQ